MALLLTLVLLLLAPTVRPAAAQVIPFAGIGSSAATKSGVSTAPALTTARAVVQLNNRFLFLVYGVGDLTAQDRADLANLRLATALRRVPAAQPPTVTVESIGRAPVIKLDGQSLITVTPADVTGSGQAPDDLAAAWAARIRQALALSLRERQPAYLRWAAKQAAVFAAIGAAIHLLLWFVSRRWRTRPGAPALILLWIITVRMILDLFPQTRPATAWLFFGPLRVGMIFLLIGLAAASLARLWGFVIRKLLPPVPENLSSEEHTERTFRRRATLGAVARVTGVTVIWTAAFLFALTWAGVNLSALLASAGLIGVVISLAAQDTMKDFVAGISILSDDRFGVGDTIQSGAFEGRVERLTLRITQIRDSAGRLVTLPNRNIAEVANATARWAQVDFKVGVSYYDDLGKALDILRASAQSVADDWPERVLAPPELLGVDAFNDTHVSLRLQVRTPPGDQWVVARELRARVKARFDAAGIAIFNTLYAPPPVPTRDGSSASPAPPAVQAAAEQAPKDGLSLPPGPEDGERKESTLQPTNTPASV